MKFNLLTTQIINPGLKPSSYSNLETGRTVLVLFYSQFAVAFSLGGCQTSQDVGKFDILRLYLQTNTLKTEKVISQLFCFDDDLKVNS